VSKVLCCSKQRGIILCWQRIYDQFIRNSKDHCLPCFYSLTWVYLLWEDSYTEQPVLKGKVLIYVRPILRLRNVQNRQFQWTQFTSKVPLLLRKNDLIFSSFFYIFCFLAGRKRFITKRQSSVLFSPSSVLMIPWYRCTKYATDFKKEFNNGFRVHQTWCDYRTGEPAALWRGWTIALPLAEISNSSEKSGSLLSRRV